MARSAGTRNRGQRLDKTDVCNGGLTRLSVPAVAVGAEVSERVVGVPRFIDRGSDAAIGLVTMAAR
jgi:hypothetical protein